MEEMDLSKVYDVTVEATQNKNGQKKTSISFAFNDGCYLLFLIRQETRWKPKSIYHLEACPYCTKKTITCHTLEQCKEKLLEVIEPKIRLKLLFE